MISNQENKRYRITIVILVLIILLLILYIAIKGIGRIGVIPTGNIDIFNINSTKKDDKNNNQNNSNNSNNDNQSNNYNNIKNDTDKNDGEETKKNLITVFDEDLTWNSENELRIFSNPAFEFQNIIAPGSTNTYQYVVNNSESFNITYSMIFIEKNKNLINMKFKLKRNGEYVLGSKDEWINIQGKSLQNLSLMSNSHDIYSLEWKWVDTNTDTEKPFDSAHYKLNINIKAQSKK